MAPVAIVVRDAVAAADIVQTGVPARRPNALATLADRGVLVLIGATAALAVLLVFVPWLRRVVVGTEPRPTSGRDGLPGANVDGHPDNEVERAWFELLNRIDRRTDGDRTPASGRRPREVGRIAIEAGLHPDAVYALTAVYEEVRQQDGDVTEEQRRRARRAVRHLDAEWARADVGERSPDAGQAGPSNE